LSSARWTATETQHVTLRFFGNTDDAQVMGLRALVTELGAELGTAAAASGMYARAPSVSGFPRARRAHVLTLDIEDEGGLAALAARAEVVAVALGFAPEERAYHAHLTLARMRKAVDVSALADEAASLPRARVTAVTLYASTTAATGPAYTPLERVVLPAPPLLSPGA
jgi:2'-5' RNA ligase